MFRPKQDPWHTRPGDGQEEAAFPQDEADEESVKKRRKWLGRVAEVALDILGEVVEGILDGIG